MHKNSPLTTRFAPSPTGFLHIGGARTALFNYIFTKQKGGKIILRIEDTDRDRNKEEFVEGIYEAFNWLELKFDAIKKQSDNFEIHKKYLEKLIANGNAYIAKVSEEEILNAKKEGKNIRSEIIRFKNPNKIITFTDIVRGVISTDTTYLGDFVIAKSFDEPIFHLSNVVDDILMGVTYIIRAEEHISNTPRQILIWEAINEAPRPTYGHIPLILGDKREKLSKRVHGEKVSIEYYKKMGYLKEAVINYLAFLGWNPGGEREIYSLDELIQIFDIAKVQKGGAIFNVEKLNWFNKEYIKKQNEDEQIEYIKKYLGNTNKYSKELLEKLRPIIIDKISYYAELENMEEAGVFSYFVKAPIFDNSDSEKNINKIIWKKSDKENTIFHLLQIKDIIEVNKKEGLEKVWQRIYDLAEEKGKGDILWPLRYAISGKEKSPDPKTIFEILGIEETLRRVDYALNSLKRE